MTNKSLADLEDAVLGIPVTTAAKEVELEIITGEDLGEFSDHLVIGVHGHQGSGKTRLALTVLTWCIEEAAEDDDHIREIFSHIPDFADWLITLPATHRRTALRQATHMIYIDFDHRGAAKNVKSALLNPRIRDQCLTYIPVTTWEEAVAAKEKGLEILDEIEHAGVTAGDKTFPAGKKGLWFVIDNIGNAWAAAQDWYVRAAYGMDAGMRKQAIFLNNPGKDRDSRSIQSSLIQKEIDMDWRVISPTFNVDWLLEMKDTGYNMMYLSPPKDRGGIMDVDGVTIEVERQTIGGSTQTPFIADYLIGMGKTEDGVQFFADIQKTRSFEYFKLVMSKKTGKMERKKFDAVDYQAETRIYNPDFLAVVSTMRKMEHAYGAVMAQIHASRPYVDELPAPGTVVELEIEEPDLEELELPAVESKTLSALSEVVEDDDLDFDLELELE